MPRFVTRTMFLMALFGLIPATCVAYARVKKSREPRVHVVFDMDQQARYKSQQTNPAFADYRAMRLPVEGTVPRGELNADDHFFRGKVGDQWAKDFPPGLDVDMALLERGRQRFAVYCAVCHGLAGEGDGPVQQIGGDAIQVASFHEQRVLDREVGHIFNTITNGNATMAAYGAQIKPRDRWAIVAYVRALQRSRLGKLADVPEDEREGLK
jgi:mono/diheme cytochrome c family protein